jgi:hypothetical protein
MKRFKKSLAAWSFVVMVVSFWVLNTFVSLSDLTNLSYALVLGISFAVLLRWARDAAIALREGREGYDFLIFGVFSIALVIFLQRVWVVAISVYNRPPWLVETPVRAFIPWMLAWSCSLVLIAPDTSNGKISSRSLYLIMLGVFVAGMASGIMVSVSLD